MSRCLAYVLVMLAASACCVALAADPPPTMSYQGVLRDAADHPRTGTFDMRFRFLDAQTSGNEILVDSHTGGAAVAVTEGLFNVQLGGGTITDGSGAGSYTSLRDVFRDYGNVWMEIAVGPETLSPRLKILSTGYAFNSGSLQGRPAAGFLDTSSNPQSKSGPLTVTSTTFGADAVKGVSEGGVVGALGSEYSCGVAAYGGPVAAFFSNYLGSSATIVNFAEGMQVAGQTRGGAFGNYYAGGALALLGHENTGIVAYGTVPQSAGHFERLYGYAGTVDLAQGDVGIIASGAYVGGKFTDFDMFAELASDIQGAAGTFVLGDIVTSVATLSGYGLVTNDVKDFIQNHPTDPTRLIAYTALEGPEAGTYTRGSGSIRGAEARIALEPTFALTTDPDVGLTAVVTPRRAGADLYVVSVSTKDLVVRSGAPSSGEVAFDYLVNGLRVGFADQPVILERDRFPNATVPSLEVSAARLAALPEDSRASTPLARLSAERARSGADAPELSGARALIAGINSSEHALHARPVNTGRHASQDRPASTGGGDDAGSEIPFTLSMPVEMEVHAGDVLSSDPAAPGRLRLAEEGGDPPVIGVVVGQRGGRFWGQATIALAGTVVPCNVDATSRPITVSDLLVASPTPGVAMSAGPDPQGTVIGKALEPLAAGTGSIRILVLSR